MDEEIETHNVFDAPPIEVDVVHLIVSAEVPFTLCEGYRYDGPNPELKVKMLCEECRLLVFNRTGIEPRAVD